MTIWLTGRVIYAKYDLENDNDYKAVKLSHLAERKKIVDQKRSEDKLSE